MPKRSNDFQQLIALLESALASESSSVTESKLLPDKVTGQLREVDVVIESIVGIHHIVIGIEVVDRRRPATVPWVEAVHAKHRDLGIDKTVLVSRAGFYRRALQKAHEKGMIAITLGDALNANWKSAIARITMFRLESVLLPSAKRITLLIDGPEPAGDDPLLSTSLATAILYGPDGTQRGNLADLVDSTLAREDVARAVTERAASQAESKFVLKVDLPAGSYIYDSVGGQRFLKGLSIAASALKEIAEIPLEGQTYQDVIFATGTGLTFGKEARVVLLQQSPDEPPHVILQIKPALALPIRETDTGRRSNQGHRTSDNLP